MCNPMPIEFLGETEGTNIKLEELKAVAKHGYKIELIKVYKTF